MKSWRHGNPLPRERRFIFKLNSNGGYLMTDIERRTPPASDLVALAAELGRRYADTAVERERKGQKPVAELRELRSSGLVNLLFARRHGGAGGTLGDAVRVIIDLSTGDAAIGALLGFHYYVSSVPRQFDFAGDAAAVQQRSTQNHWLWANVHQPTQPDFIATPTSDGGFLLNGSKRWATGVTLADVTTVIAQRSDRAELLFAYIPTNRAGLTYRDDWDNLGLRLAETVTADFVNVQVKPDEVIRSTHNTAQVTFPPFYAAFVMPIYSSIFIGSARAAVERAKDHVLARPKARAVSGVERAGEDPLALTLFGKLWRKVLVAEDFVLQVADEVQDAFEHRLSLSERQREEVTLRAFAARALAAQTALDVTPQVYDIVGTTGSANSLGFDRHWRDVRTLSLHDSIAYSIKSAGDFVLNDVVRGFPSFVAKRPAQSLTPAA